MEWGINSSMNKHSIFTHIKLFFGLLLVVINILLFLQYFVDANEAKMIKLDRYEKVMRIMRPNHQDIINQERELWFLKLKLSKLEHSFIEHNGQYIEQIGPFATYSFQNKKFVFFAPPPPNNRSQNMMPPPPQEHFQKLEFEQKHKDDKFVIEDLNEYKSIEFSWFIFGAIINILLIWFYLFLIHKLNPLIKLRKNIELFGDGNMDFTTAMAGKDEISDVANAFDKALLKIKTLQSSRNLFLRNIMHEIKTPITKAMITIEMLENNKYKDRLYRVFERIDYLLGEFSKIELLTSSELSLKKQKFKVVECVYQAFDLLMIDVDSVNVYDEGTFAVVDFELFSISLKNLIDNGLKYGVQKPKIEILKEKILIKSYGNELTLKEQNFENMFNKKFESSQTGLGLGLYITNAIVKAHGFSFKYSYENGENIFEIIF